MALAYPKELDVVAITTVHGNSSCKNVTCNVLRLLQVAKRLDVRLLMILLLVIMLILSSNTYYIFIHLWKVVYRFSHTDLVKQTCLTEIDSAVGENG